MAKTRRGSLLPLLCTFTVCTAAGALVLDALRGERAPQVQFTLIGAEPVQTAQLLGRPLIVNFWATTCSICRHEMPKLAELYREFHPRGLAMIGVAMPYDPPNLVAEFVQRSRLPYPVSLDIDGEIVEAFGDIAATPTTFLIAPDGTILKRREGRIDFPALRTQLLAILARPRPERPGSPEAAPAGVEIQITGR